MGTNAEKSGKTKREIATSKSLKTAKLRGFWHIVKTQFVLEVAAITHDIACPLCREKYGNTNGKHQEQEGEIMVRDFLAGTGMSEEQIKRIAYLVGHHHTFIGIDGIDYQILVEADYIANATENGYSRQNVENFMQKIMKTESGKRILKSIFALCRSNSSFTR